MSARWPRRRVRRLLLYAALLLPGWAAAQAPEASRYLDPPETGLTHAGQWIVETAPSLVYATRSRLSAEARMGTGYGLDLRLARGLAPSGDEIGLRLRPMRLGSEYGLMIAAGYRLSTGRERWKTHLELELALPWIGGPEIGLRISGGVLHELGPRVGLLLEGGLVGAVGQVLLGWVEVRGALQLRF